MNDPQAYPYATFLNVLHPALSVVDVPSLVRANTHPWYNQTLCQVNDSVVRLGVLKGEYHWHKHDHDDEFFFVLDGHFLIDLEDRTVDLAAAAGLRRAQGRRAPDACAGARRHPDGRDGGDRPHRRRLSGASSTLAHAPRKGRAIMADARVTEFRTSASSTTSSSDPADTMAVPAAVGPVARTRRARVRNGIGSWGRGRGRRARADADGHARPAANCCAACATSKPRADAYSSARRSCSGAYRPQGRRARGSARETGTGRGAGNHCASRYGCADSGNAATTESGRARSRRQNDRTCTGGARGERRDDRSRAARRAGTRARSAPVATGSRAARRERARTTDTRGASVAGKGGAAGRTAGEDRAASRAAGESRTADRAARNRARGTRGTGAGGQARSAAHRRSHAGACAARPTAAAAATVAVVCPATRAATRADAGAGSSGSSTTSGSDTAAGIETPTDATGAEAARLRSRAARSGERDGATDASSARAAASRARTNAVAGATRARRTRTSCARRSGARGAATGCRAGAGDGSARSRAGNTLGDSGAFPRGTTSDCAVGCADTCAGTGRAVARRARRAFGAVARGRCPGSGADIALRTSLALRNAADAGGGTVQAAQTGKRSGIGDAGRQGAAHRAE